METLREGGIELRPIAARLREATDNDDAIWDLVASALTQALMAEARIVGARVTAGDRDRAAGNAGPAGQSAELAE